MSEREKAVQLLNSVPDDKIGCVIGYIQALVMDKQEKPNTETIKAIEELENGGGEIFEGSAHDFLQMMLEE